MVYWLRWTGRRDVCESRWKRQGVLEKLHVRHHTAFCSICTTRQSVYYFFKVQNTSAVTFRVLSVDLGLLCNCSLAPKRSNNNKRAQNVVCWGARCEMIYILYSLLMYDEYDCMPNDAREMLQQFRQTVSGHATTLTTDSQHNSARNAQCSMLYVI